MKNSFLDYAHAALVGALVGILLLGIAFGAVALLFKFGWPAAFAIVLTLALLLALVTWLKSRKVA